MCTVINYEKYCNYYCLQDINAQHYFLIFHFAIFSHPRNLFFFSKNLNTSKKWLQDFWVSFGLAKGQFGSGLAQTRAAWAGFGSGLGWIRVIWMESSKIRYNNDSIFMILISVHQANSSMLRTIHLRYSSNKMVHHGKTWTAIKKWFQPFKQTCTRWNKTRPWLKWHNF